VGLVDDGELGRVVREVLHLALAVPRAVDDLGRVLRRRLVEDRGDLAPPRFLEVGATEFDEASCVVVVVVVVIVVLSRPL
jgi:hypothetical protein